MMITNRLARIYFYRRFSSSSSKPPSEKIKKGTPEIDSVANEKAASFATGYLMFIFYKFIATGAQKKLAKEEMYMEKKASEAMDTIETKKTEKEESKGIIKETCKWLGKKLTGK